jgi:hypothetical protein
MMKFLSFILMLNCIIPLTLSLNFYDQCGGIGYAGSTLCPAGSTCVRNSDWWSQCNPTSTKTSAPITSTTNVLPTVVGAQTTTTTPKPLTTSNVSVNCTKDDTSCPTLSCTSLLATMLCPIKCQNPACKSNKRRLFSNLFITSYKVAFY